MRIAGKKSILLGNYGMPPREAMGQMDELPVISDEHATVLLAAIVESSDDAIVSKTLDGVIMANAFPDVPVKGELGEFETLLSNKKAREMLGFQQKHFWRNYVKM